MTVLPVRRLARTVSRRRSLCETRHNYVPLWSVVGGSVEVAAVLGFSLAGQTAFLLLTLSHEAIRYVRETYELD